METSPPTQKEPPEQEHPEFSFWSIMFIIIGILLIVGGVVSMVFVEKSGAWIYTVVLIGSGIQCFFCSFLVGVFTDMRWYLRKLVEKTKEKL